MKSKVLGTFNSALLLQVLHMQPKFIIKTATN